MKIKLLFFVRNEENSMRVKFVILCTGIFLLYGCNKKNNSQPGEEQGETESYDKLQLHSYSCMTGGPNY